MQRLPSYSLHEVLSLRSFFAKLGPFRFTVHNLIAHPLMEILHLIGLSKWGDRIHDATLPEDHNDNP